MTSRLGNEGPLFGPGSQVPRRSLGSTKYEYLTARQPSAAWFSMWLTFGTFSHP